MIGSVPNKQGHAEMEDYPSDVGVILKYTGAIVAAYVSNNPVQINNLSAFIQIVHGALSSPSSPTNTKAQTHQKPAVPIHKSVTPDYLVCLEDGKRLKILKRHLRARYGMSPADYRVKWDLPHDYPMVAPNYAAWRSEFAKKVGLGHSRPAAKHRRRV
jgi:predicted transcriptional regulator